jgi:succinate-semialdehyde dehydrogenase/glutarate-semialdehyde dehydrogenase
MPIQSVNPATGALLRRYDPLTPEALEARLALAALAAATYPAESLDDRAFWMRRLALLLEDDCDELAATMTAEMGKTLASARAEVLKCAAACRYFAANAAALLESQPIATEHPSSYVRWDPIGVVLAVMPWNFPLWQVFRFLAPALMAGNVGLLKHASNVPQCALTIEALVRRAGFPRGTFQTLLIEATQVESVLADPRIAAVTVTGSEATGRAVAAQAGWLIKKSVLELGGCDPFIVLPSANLDTAIDAAVTARTINNGQSCIAAKRFLVHDSIYAEFETRFTAAMAALRVGDPTLEDTQIGPLATPQILSTLLTQVHAAVAAGGRLLTGGQRLPSPGNFFSPTVIADVPRTAAIAKEETFGPLALLFRISSIEDAIALANDTPFGLAASAWTRDLAEQQTLAAGLQCGVVVFNAPVASDPRLPFGGIKHSGYGRELAGAGMKEFLNAKTVIVGSLIPLPTQPTLFAPTAATTAPTPSFVPPPAPAPIAPPVAARAPIVVPPADLQPPVLRTPVAPQRGQLKPIDTGEFRLPPLPGYEPHEAPQLKPLDTGEFRLPPLPGYEPHEAPRLKPLDTGEFRLPPLPGYEPHEAPRLKPLDTGEFRLPPLDHKPYTGPIKLKPLNTGEYRLPPLDGVETGSSYEDDDDDDPPPMRGSILGLR